MHIQRAYIWISFLVIGAYVGLGRFAYKPRFVVPTTIATIFYRIGSFIAFFCLTLLPLQIHRENGKETYTTVPVQILFDVSLSMAANDIEPSRFVAAKKMVDQLLIGRSNYPSSIILFSGIPFVHVPFSSVTDAVRAKRQTTHLGQFPPVAQFVGTAIGDALLLAVNNLDKNNYTDGIILLITDGDSNKGYEPRDVLDILIKKDVPVFAVGIGQTDPFIVGYDYFGGQVLTTYNPAFLQEITDATGGKTRVAEDTQTVYTIVDDIIQTINTRATEKTRTQYFMLNNILIAFIITWLTVLTLWRIGAIIDKK